MNLGLTTNTISQILSFLKKDEINNINIINFIKQNEIIWIKQIDDSVFVKGISDKEWIYISCRNKDDFNKFLQSINKDDIYFAVIEDWMLPIISNQFAVEVELSAIKYILPKEVILPPTVNNILPLTEEYSDYIYQNYSYKDYTNAEYIKERIVNGISAGIFYSDKLIAWSITHDDGAIGMLQVIPEYRRKGFAKDITIYMIHEIRKQNKIPFVQIEENNIASNNLAASLGFINAGKVHWIRRI